MTIDIFDRWYGAPMGISRDQWDAVFNGYFEERGIDTWVAHRYTPDHPMFYHGHFNNWLRALPSDVGHRMCSTDDLHQELANVVTEVYSALEKDVEGNLESPDSVHKRNDGTPVSDAKRRTGIEAFLCAYIGGYLRGDIDVGKVIAGEVEPLEDAPVEPSSGPTTVEVRSRNKHNFVDIAIFNVEDGFFDETYGESTAMFDRLYRSDAQPDLILENVAFDWEGSSWIRTETPRQAIHTTSTDHKNRVSYVRIEDPVEVYGESWGDLESMYERQSEVTESEPESSLITHVGQERIDWTLDTGLRCS